MKVAVFGASGVVGLSAARHFSQIDGASVVGVSRRPPGVPGVHHVALDLLDRGECQRILSSSMFRDTTHVVYAALQEGGDLLAGWRDEEVMARNLAMFKNAIEPLTSAPGARVEHVSLLQGAKAYGFHVGRSPLPAKERQPRDRHANFYFMQEDALLEAAGAAGFAWTVLRPQVVYGESIGSPMNLLPAIGVYAAVERARGRPLSFPGGPPLAQEAVDARLLAEALTWAATDSRAHGQTFNITNGDVFCWEDVWSTIADALGMEVGPPAPAALASVMPARAGEWAGVVDRFRLESPRQMAAFVGQSWVYADVMFGGVARRQAPVLLSTVKIRQAGFGTCVDTEDMFREWLCALQDRRLLPPAP